MVLPGGMMRLENRLSMKNGAMQSVRGIWRSVKALRECSGALVANRGRRRSWDV